MQFPVVFVRVASLTVLMALVSCNLLGGKKTEPIKTPDDPSYLEGGSPTRLDVSPGQETVLEALRNATQEMKDLQTKYSAAQQELTDVQLRLSNVEQQRDQERSARLAAEAQQLEANKRLRDREARLLDLSLKHAKTERELIELKIKALEASLGSSKNANAVSGR